MTIVSKERRSDSSFVETITHGFTAAAGSTIRPAASHWHMVIVKHPGARQLLIVGPLASAGIASWGEGAEIVWIKFRLGTFMPHLPTRNFLNSETALPEASSDSFWFQGSRWQLPDHENADTFVDRLAREEILVRDPVVNTVLAGQPHDIPDRTIRHRFLRATGLTQSKIRQFERAQLAVSLLEQRVSILDTVFELGYFDQPHLTRALKHWIGYTPAQIIRNYQAVTQTCHSVQDGPETLVYDTSVLERL